MHTSDPRYGYANAGINTSFTYYESLAGKAVCQTSSGNSATTRSPPRCATTAVSSANRDDRPHGR